MLKVDEYEKIRRAYYIEQKSIRQIARERGHSRKSVQKALGNSEPKPYQRQEERTAPTLGGYKARIAALLEENQQLPRKQRYTGHKIYEVIAREGYVGSESGVRRYIGAWRRLHNSPAVYLPLEFEPGADAQADWGEGEVVMAGERISVQLFTIRLCYSRRLFMMAFPSQKLEAFLEGHVAAFGYFEGVPQRISYDNLKTAVKDILGGQARQEQAGFLAFRSHYLFESHFCTPGQGHEKGGVEHGVGYGRRNFLVPLPEVASYAELNAYLLAQCLADEARTVHGQTRNIREAWQTEKAALLPLPEQEYVCCKTLQVSLTPYSQVIFETNRYSVPVGAGRRVLTLRVYTFRLEILHEGEVLASHERCYGQAQDIFDPLHYLPLLESRPGAFDYAKPLRAWRAEWSPVYEQALAQLRSLWPDGRGVREFVQILRLHQDHPPRLIEQALSAALAFGCVHYEGVRLCLNQLLLPQQLPLPLALEGTPLAQLQHSGTQAVDLQAYDLLIGDV